MAGKRKRTSYGGRRRVRRKTTGRRKMRVSKPVKAYVKQVIHSNIENKEYINYGVNQGCSNTAGIPENRNLLPVLSQGLTAAGRIGNKVKIVKGMLKLRVNILPYNATTNTLSTPILVRVLLLSSKQYLSPAFADSNPQNYLWDVSSSAVGLQNNPLDMMLPVNAQLYTTYLDKQFKLGAGYASSTGPVGTGGYYDNSSMTKSMTINWGKHFKAPLLFNDTISNSPTNRSLWLVIVPINADGSGTVTPVEFHYVNRVSYEDA